MDSQSFGAAQNIINCWKAGRDAGHPPRKYAEKIMKYFGKPDDYSPKKLVWYTFPALENIEYPEPLPLKIKVIDEYISHNFPAEHHDFVYTVSYLPKRLRMEWQHVANLSYVTGSIVIDTLKQTVTARCGGLRANQITLGFVYDYVRGAINGVNKEVNKENREALKEEYARRILGNVFPDDGMFANVFPDEITKGGGKRKSTKQRKVSKRRKVTKKRRKRKKSKKKRD